MNKSKSLKGIFNRLFGNRKFTVPFSILAAIMFWLVITINQNPQREVTISGLPVSIATANTVVEELGLDVIGNINSKISVVVSGPTYIVSSLTAEDLSVTANMSEVNAAGTYEIPLTANKTGSKAGYNIISVVPEKVSLTFDYINETQFNVEAVANGASAVKGLIADTPVVTNNEDSLITVRGPRSYIEKIFAVRAVADVDEVLSQTTSYDAKVIAVDENGKTMDDTLFTFSTSSVKISVPIYKQKTVKLVPTFTNTPAGFGASPIAHTLSETQIRIKGTPETIDAITEIKLAPINFYEISDEKTSFDVALSLPTGVKVIDNVEAVTVKINTSGYRQRTFNITDCRAINLEKGSKIAKINTVRNVKIFGPEAVVRRLSASNLYAEVDVKGKAAGQYTIGVTVKSATSDKIWQVGSYTTVVVIQ